jgi:diadenosine tetraphosphate (Ap4A) HIT family hydrolase
MGATQLLALLDEGTLNMSKNSRSDARMATLNACPFCTLPTERILMENSRGIVVRDGFPVTPSHTLIISKRHVGSFFELSAAERTDLFSLLDQARESLNQQCKPDGYNIGINDGATAGQTIPHVHIHLIPRFEGDQADPRGGVRWIIPEKADYWTRS